MIICGPRLSLFGLLLSIWGVIQLVLMGIFLQVKSLSFVEDAIGAHKLEKTAFESNRAFFDHVDKIYSAAAIQCWIAAALYLLLLFFSACQFWLNQRCRLPVTKRH